MQGKLNGRRKNLEIKLWWERLTFFVFIRVMKMFILTTYYMFSYNNHSPETGQLIFRIVTHRYNSTHCGVDPTPSSLLVSHSHHSQGCMENGNLLFIITIIILCLIIAT